MEGFGRGAPNGRTGELLVLEGVVDGVDFAACGFRTSEAPSGSGPLLGAPALTSLPGFFSTAAAPKPGAAGLDCAVCDPVTAFAAAPDFRLKLGIFEPTAP